MRPKAILSLLPVLLLVGCSRPQGPATPASAPAQTATATTLTVWDWLSADPSQGVGHWLTEVDEQFGQAHPGVNLKHVAQSHTEYYEILKAAEAAAGQQGGPDVVMIHQGSRVMDHRQSLLPLDKYVPPELKKKIVGWELTSEGFSAEGTPYAVPVAVQGLAWYYNRQVLAQAGLDPGKPPSTWDEFLSACGKVKAAGYAPIAAGEKEGDWADWFVNSAYFLDLSDADRVALQSGAMSWTDPKVESVLRRFAGLGERGFFQEGFMSTPLFPDTGEVFMRGEAAFILGLLSDVAHWKEFSEILGPENVGVMMCPGADRLPVGGGFAYGIASWSPNPDLAFEYISLIVSDENANAFLAQAGSFPANQDYDAGQIKNPTAKQIAGWVAEGKTGQPLTAQVPTEVVEALKRECQRILTGQTDIPAALAAIDAVAKAAREGGAE